jgi:hypothetical protein
MLPLFANMTLSPVPASLCLYALHGASCGDRTSSWLLVGPLLEQLQIAVLLLPAIWDAGWT